MLNPAVHTCTGVLCGVCVLVEIIIIWDMCACGNNMGYVCV